MGSTGVKGRRADPAAGIPGSGYTTSFQLSNTQDGWLYSAYMARLRCPRAARGVGACAQGSLRTVEPPTLFRQAGLLVGSPLLSEASKHVSPLRVIAGGISVW